jgi:hypothetical protein
MNKKRLNIILIPLAVGLWIFIVLRIVTYIRPQQEDEDRMEVWYPEAESIETSDTLKLLLNYPDPFSRSSARNIDANSNSLPATGRFFDRYPDAPLPDIVFTGTIEPYDRSQTVALLKVNGRSVLVSGGDTVAGMNIISLWKDSVKVRFSRREYTIKR